MKKLFYLLLVLFLAACGERSNAPYEPNLSSYEEATTSEQFRPTLPPTSQDDDSDPPSTVELLLPQEISEYGFNTALDFLRTLTSLRTGVYRAMAEWDGANNAVVATGEFSRWCMETGELLRKFETPEIYFSHYQDGVSGFFDQQNNLITDAPWMQHDNYAAYFSLFDFDGNGIPVIFVHFNQTFEGGYGGFYRVFRYVDGAYRMLETRSFTNGIETQWPWLSAIHRLLVDEDGRIITFALSDYHGIYEYTHLILTDTCAEMHLVTALDDWEDWELWHEHHREEWDWTQQQAILLYSWLDHNPTIFGTDIAIRPIESFTELEEYIMEVLRRN